MPRGPVLSKEPHDPTKGDITNSEFVIRKGVHIKLHRFVHQQLRAKLFPYNVSMQEVFEEFAERFISNDEFCKSIVEQVVMEKVKGNASRQKCKPYDNLRKYTHDTLYDMINSDEEIFDQNSR